MAKMLILTLSFQRENVSVRFVLGTYEIRQPAQHFKQSFRKSFNQLKWQDLANDILKNYILLHQL